MPRYFLDSSALIKRYHQESGSAELDILFNAPGNRFFISRLALVEVHSAFARLVREQLLSASDFRQLITRLEEDVATGILAVAAVSSQRLEGAESIFSSHGLVNPIRTLDAIHLATALALHGRSRLAGFVVADKKLLAVAAACGLQVIEMG
jgi:uncharacterized protein